MSVRDTNVYPWVDTPILSCLPAEGSKVGQFRPLTVSTKGVRESLGNEFTSDEVAARLRSLQVNGYVVGLPMPNDRLGWQITPKGQELLAQLREENAQ